MRRALTALGLAMAMVAVSAAAAGAMSFHFKNVTFGSGSLTFNAKAAGLANMEYEVFMEATASVTAMCENKGGNQAPGRNALTATESNSAAINTDHNGTDDVFVSVAEPTTASFGDVPPSNKEAGCPNGKNWSIVDLTLNEWTGAHIIVTEVLSGEVVFDQQYVCSGKDATVSCSAA